MSNKNSAKRRKANAEYEELVNAYPDVPVGETARVLHFIYLLKETEAEWNAAYDKLCLKLEHSCAEVERLLVIEQKFITLYAAKDTVDRATQTVSTTSVDASTSVDELPEDPKKTSSPRTSADVEVQSNPIEVVEATVQTFPLDFCTNEEQISPSAQESQCMEVDIPTGNSVIEAFPSVDVVMKDSPAPTEQSAKDLPQKKKGKSSSRRKRTPLMVQCYHCQRFGHIAAKCQDVPRCCQCGKDHNSRDCDATKDDAPLCVNCQGKHKSSSRTCPAFPKKPPLPKEKVPGKHSVREKEPAKMKKKPQRRRKPDKSDGSFGRVLLELTRTQAAMFENMQKMMHTFNKQLGLAAEVRKSQP